MKKAYITGPTGAIGLALVDKLNSEGVDVAVIVRPDSKRAQRLISEGAFGNAEIINCDLKDFKCLDCSSLSDGDVFYHLGWMGTSGAARMDMKLQLQNADYTLDALELAAKLNCKRFVGVGSQAEYGRCSEQLTNDTPLNPENGYGIAKLMAGKMSRIRAKQLGIEHVWTRVLSVYGKGDNENTLISSLISNLINGNEVHCTKGEQMWNYINSKDAAEYLYRLGYVENVDGKTYCIAGESARPLREYMKIVQKVINEKNGGKDCPKIIFDRPYPEGQVMYLDADISELVRVSGYSPKIKFEDGISELVNV